MLDTALFTGNDPSSHGTYSLVGKLDINHTDLKLQLNGMKDTRWATARQRISIQNI